MSDHFKTMKNDDWGTPQEIVEAARLYMGGIDLDPASSAEHNQIIGATRFLGLPDVDPDVGVPTDWRNASKIFINPPGGKFGKRTLVSLFWEHLSIQVRTNRNTSFVWVAYNINQLQTLQLVNETLIAHCSLCVPNRRVSYLDETNTPVNGTPSASAIIAYNPQDLYNKLFSDSFSAIGKCWRA